jgi:hypothetical protein
MSVTQTCTVCDRPTQTNLCGSCLAEVVTALRQLVHAGVLRTRIHTRGRGDDTQQRSVVEMRPGLYEELIVTLARQHKLGGATGKTSGNTEKPVLFHEGASEVRWALDNTISTWARDVAETYQMALTATTTVEAADWLASRVTHLSGHPAADELHDEITSIVHRVRQVIDRMADRVYIGPCDGQGADDVEGFEPCGSSLFGKPGLSWARCSVCGREYHVQARRDWLLASLEDHMGSSTYVAMVASGLGVKVAASTIRMWVKRKKLYPRHWAPPPKPGGNPRPLYRVGDVVAVAAGNEVATWTA